MDLRIIDGLAPFFLEYDKKVINWSKIPFLHLEKGKTLKKRLLKKIRRRFNAFIDTVSRMGYNAVSLDDVAHLAILEGYSDILRGKIDLYRIFFSGLFEDLKSRGIKIFLNSDIMFFHESQPRGARKFGNAVKSLLQAVVQVMDLFPIDGIIFRLGECDGRDVEGDLLSELVVRTPLQANTLIRALLPDFEKRNRFLIFRTWTVGAYPIGDLMWNRTTFDKAFQGIESPSFLLSLKPGESDFYGKMELNPLFFHGPWNRIIEIQCRLEREGFGFFPNYAGWEYKRWAEKTGKLAVLKGISVWSQTGGWSRDRSLTFVRKSSVWNELNTEAAIRIFNEARTADEIVLEKFGKKKGPRMIRFLVEFKEILDHILYAPGLSGRPLYFRRIRVPTNLWMAWNHISINPFIVSLYRKFKGGSPPVKLRQIKELGKIGKRLGVPYIMQIRSLLAILYWCRKALAGYLDLETLSKACEIFLRSFPDSPFRFSIQTDMAGTALGKALLGVLIRRKKEYRLFDRFLMQRPLSFGLSALANVVLRRKIPKLAAHKSMSLGTLFR